MTTPIEDQLSKILDELYLDAWGSGRIAEREQSGIRSVTPNFRDAKTNLLTLFAHLASEAKPEKGAGHNKYESCCDYCDAIDTYEQNLLEAIGRES